jgi:predicted nuclease of predicted toxin-antitoxin system
MEIWDFAKVQGLTIVTEDSDFEDMLLMKGFPPKIVWIRRGNCDTEKIEKLLREHADEIWGLGSRSDIGILALY